MSVKGLPSQSLEPFITRRELAKLMGVSLSTVDQLRSWRRGFGLTSKLIYARKTHARRTNDQ